MFGGEDAQTLHEICERDPVAPRCKRPEFDVEAKLKPSPEELNRLLETGGSSSNQSFPHDATAVARRVVESAPGHVKQEGGSEFEATSSVSPMPFESHAARRENPPNAFPFAKH